MGEHRVPKEGRKRLNLIIRREKWKAGDKQSGRARYLHEFYKEIVAYAPHGLNGPHSTRMFKNIYLTEIFAAINPPFHPAETKEDADANPYRDRALLKDLQRQGLLPPHEHNNNAFYDALNDLIDTRTVNQFYGRAYRHVSEATPGGLPPITMEDDKTHWTAEDLRFEEIIGDYQKIYQMQYNLRQDLSLAQKAEEDRIFEIRLAQLAQPDDPALWPYPAYDPSLDRWRPQPGDWTEGIWNPGVTHFLSPRETMQPSLERQGRLDLLAKYDDTRPGFCPRQSRLQMIAPIMIREEVLREALKSGVVPMNYRPHLAAFVGDLPPSTLERLVGAGAVTCKELRAIAWQLLPKEHPTRVWLASQPAD